LINPALNVEYGKMVRILPKNIVTEKEARSLLSAPGDTWQGARDQAILELLYGSAIRRGELLKLDIADVNLAERIVHLRDTKNRRDRMVPIGKKASLAIKKYITARREMAGDYPQRALFLGVREGKRLYKKVLDNIIKKYVKKTALSKKITSHSFRHSCASHLLKNGANLRIIQQILGHQRISSTEIYTRVVVKDLEDVIKKYHPSCRRKQLNKKLRDV